ncbi:hypothetical protein Pmani_029939 [Petrolisthes manimaculis]|uniref:Uncharacterized protein n=1 Tax=Petrolisthes manimaculis TaxID=1843537 RepID=A0AAE1NYC8_9EUCA|nr:hypothetical protein Pmani_029939 [Petrolisthes manimaculis]
MGGSRSGKEESRKEKGRVLMWKGRKKEWWAVVPVSPDGLVIQPKITLRLKSLATHQYQVQHNPGALFPPPLHLLDNQPCMLRKPEQTALQRQHLQHDGDTTAPEKRLRMRSRRRKDILKEEERVKEEPEEVKEEQFTEENKERELHETGRQINERSHLN